MEIGKGNNWVMRINHFVTLEQIPKISYFVDCKKVSLGRRFFREVMDIGKGNHWVMRISYFVTLEQILKSGNSGNCKK